MNATDTPRRRMLTDEGAAGPGRRWPVVVALVVGGVVGGAAMHALCRVGEGARDARLRSDVYGPVGYALEDVVKTYDRGEVELAERKVRALRQRWGEFLNGGPTPEGLVEEVVKSGGAATRSSAR